MSRALREEYATDEQGKALPEEPRRSHHEGRCADHDVAILDNAPREYMQKAFTQRREQIVGDCVQLATDVEVYNDMNKDKEPIRTLFDFRDDVEERRFWDKDDAA